jgi:hypothetical protein
VTGRGAGETKLEVRALSQWTISRRCRTPQAERAAETCSPGKKHDRAPGSDERTQVLTLVFGGVHASQHDIPIYPARRQAPSQGPTPRAHQKQRAPLSDSSKDIGKGQFLTRSQFLTDAPKDAGTPRIQATRGFPDQRLVSDTDLPAKGLSASMRALALRITLSSVEGSA